MKKIRKEKNLPSEIRKKKKNIFWHIAGSFETCVLLTYVKIINFFVLLFFKLVFHFTMSYGHDWKFFFLSFSPSHHFFLFFTFWQTYMHAWELLLLYTHVCYLSSNIVISIYLSISFIFYLSIFLLLLLLLFLAVNFFHCCYCHLFDCHIFIWWM